MFRLKSQNIAIIKPNEIILYQFGQSQNPILFSHPQADDLKVDMILIETDAPSHEYEEYPSLKMWEFYALARNKGRQSTFRYGYFSRNLRKKTISTSSVLLSPFQESFLGELMQKNRKMPPIFTYESLLMYLKHQKPHMIFIRPFDTGLILTLLKDGVAVLSRHFKSDLYMLNDFIDETLKYGSRYGIPTEEIQIVSLDLILEKQNNYTHVTFPQFISFLRLKWVSSFSLLQHASASQIRNVFRQKRFLFWANLMACFCFLGCLSVILPLMFQSHQHQKHIERDIKTTETDLLMLTHKTKDFPLDWRHLTSKVRGREITFTRSQIFLGILQKLSSPLSSHSEIQSIVFSGNASDNLLKIHLSPCQDKKRKILEKTLQKQFPFLTVMIKQKSTDVHFSSHELIGEKDIQFESDLILTEQPGG